MSEDEITTEVLIVGAGPIGLELACALKRLGVDYRHVEAGQIGQTVWGYPKQVRFFSSPERIAIAGVPLETPDQEKASRETYLAYLRAVVSQFDLEVSTFERVVRVERRGAEHGDGGGDGGADGGADGGGGFAVHTARQGGAERHYRCGALVLAVGDMHRPRRLGIPGEALAHVSHHFEEPHRYFRRRLFIVGGRNSAVEAALRTYRAGAQVAISYRRAAFDASHVKYWLLPELQSLIRAGKITFHPRTVPIAIDAETVTLAAVAEGGAAGDGAGDEAGGGARPVRVPAEAVLLMTGYEMVPTLFEMAGVTLEGVNRSPRFDPATMETDVPGLYVAGTAAAGTQAEFRLFIENAHQHVSRIVRALTGKEAPAVNPAARDFELPES